MNELSNETRIVKIAGPDGKETTTINQVLNQILAMGINIVFVLSILFFIMAILKKIKIRKLTSEDEIKKAKKSFKIYILLGVTLLIIFLILMFIKITNTPAVVRS